MNYIFLDIYKKSSCRISKDTAGGYGTVNDLGDGIFGKLLSAIIKWGVFWPNLSFAQLLQQLVSCGHKCVYHKFVSLQNLPKLDQYDGIFVCASIVCHETEIKLLNRIRTITNAPIFYCGTFPEYSDAVCPNKSVILSGNYEFADLQNFSSVIELDKFVLENNNKAVNHPALNRRLQLIEWGSNGLPIPRNLFLGGVRPYIPYIFTRGCPYSCSYYCTYPTSQGKKATSVDISSVVADMEKIASRYPNAHVVFRDPVFSINLKKAKELMEEIGKKKLSIDFSVELHLKNIDDEFIKIAKESNFSAIKFGIESALEFVRDNSRRASINNDAQYQIVQKLKASKIKTIGMFILGQPNDTKETCLETISYASRLGLDIAQFSIFTPYPGTPYYAEIHEAVHAETYEQFTQFNPVFNHDKLDTKGIRKLLEYGYLKFLSKKYSPF